jgi:outer membrane protein assembly factor BamD (BamD/ComL family)
MMKNIFVAALSSVLFFQCTSHSDKLLQEIAAQEKRLYADTIITPREDSLAKATISNYEALAKEINADSIAANYLFKAADLCKGTRRFKQAIDDYGVLIQKYPQSPKAPLALFLQAFTYETEMNDLVMAKKLYEEFLQKYPAHQMAKSAEASIAQLGMSPDELIKMFEQKAHQDSLKAKGNP